MFYAENLETKNGGWRKLEDAKREALLFIIIIIIYLIYAGYSIIHQK